MTLLDQDKPVVVSDQIAEPVRRVAERSWALRVSMGMLQACTLALAVTLGGILALGMLPGMPITLRVMLAVGSWGIGIWGLIHWALPAFKRLPFFSAARAIDEAHPETFESISSAIELSAERDPRFKGSQELINHLIKQAEQDAAAIDPADVVSGKSVLRWIGLALAVLSMYFIAMVSVPRTFKEGLRGMAMPWVPGQTHVPVELKVEPGENITVAQGESLDITVTVNDPTRPDSTVDRAIVTISYANGPAQAVEMERADTKAFRTRLSAIQQNLSYSVSALGEESPTYKVNVVPRPGVASMSVVYNYPAYTRMAPKEDTSPANGTLEAIAGTHARVTIRTTQPVEPDKCNIAIAQGQNMIQLHASDATTLTGEVTITTSTSYLVNLVSKVDGRELKSDSTRARQIVARPDEAPRVTIQAPGATARVRPDDSAPIRFTLEDDFGITSAEMVVQVENRTPETIALDLGGATGVHSEHTFSLPVREVIQRSSLRDPKRITYFVRATDNAQPKANIGTSAKQVLELDRNADRLSLREDMAAAQATAEALRTAEQKLTSAAKKLADLEKVSAERQFSGGERQRLTEARQEMTEATQAMEKAMEMAPRTLEKQREELRQINDKLVRPGTEAAARAELSDDGKRRQSNIAEASEQAAKARDELSAMRQKVDKGVEDERLKKALADAAQRQQQLARDMENGGRPGEMQNRQESLKKDVEQMIRENENLRDAAKQKAEPKVKSLADKLDDIARRQQKVNETISDAAETAQINEKLKKIIAEQEKLNADIARLDRQAGTSARAAQAPIPDETKTGNIVTSLKGGQLQGAQAQMRVVAGELDRTASRGAPADDQNAGADLETIKQDIDKLGQDIQTAKTAGQGVDRPSDGVNQKAQELATAVFKASSRPTYTNDQRRMQQDARNFAQQASNAARAGRAEEAQQKLGQALQELQRITPKITAQAAKQARTLADRQRQLAEETSKLNAATREADQRREDFKRSESEQKEIASDIDSAEKEARDLAKEMQPTNPEAADQAKRAADSLKRAAADQRKAADSSKDMDTQMATKTAQRSYNEVQQAKGELRPEEAKNAAQNQQEQNGQQNPQQTNAQQNQPANNQQMNQNAAKNDAQAQQNNAEQKAQNDQNGQQKQADGAQAQNQEQQKPNAGESGQQANTPKDGSQQQGRQEQAGQNQQGQQAQSGQQQNGQQQNGSQQAKAQESGSQQSGAQQSGSQQSGSQQSGSQQSGNQQASSGQQQGSQSGNQQGNQAGQQQGGQSQQQQQLAQAVQDAYEAQQQAASEGSAAAAQRAAQALTRAQQLSQQMSGQSSQQQGGQQQPGQQASGSSQKPGKQTNPNPQQASGGGNDQAQGQPGAQAANPTGGELSKVNDGPGKTWGDPRPASVKEIGIAPSDWARLPPLLQKDLLHAAQQKGPPEYQQMIKNYYTQVARMQTDGDNR